MSFDTKCFTLACAFLSDEPTIPLKKADQLAQVIQNVIEDWIEDNRPLPTPEEVQIER